MLLYLYIYCCWRPLTSGASGSVVKHHFFSKVGVLPTRNDDRSKWVVQQQQISENVILLRREHYSVPNASFYLSESTTVFFKFRDPSFYLGESTTFTIWGWLGPFGSLWDPSGASLGPSGLLGITLRPLWSHLALPGTCWVSPLRPPETPLGLIWHTIVQIH